ncbi:hypothetical protein LJC56_05650 [Christensenellaceae bacterium OttesenSCG-928-K19]|nr:hypothetical protein [Christensenellaceae bacterium OttesenSCG-928-K19]
MELLLLDSDRARQDAIARQIRESLATDTEISFDFQRQRKIFDALPEKDFVAVWIWIGGMDDLEAARLLARVAPKLPLVFYSDSDEYAIESYRIGACYYLEYPVNVSALNEALIRCGLLKE